MIQKSFKKVILYIISLLLFNVGYSQISHKEIKHKQQKRMAAHHKYRKAEVKYEPSTVTGYKWVKENLEDGADEPEWQPPEKIENLFTLANIIRMDSSAMEAVRNVIVNMDPCMKKAAIPVYIDHLNTIRLFSHRVNVDKNNINPYGIIITNIKGNIPDKARERLLGEKRVNCVLPQSHRNYAWILSCLGQPAIEPLMINITTNKGVYWEAQCGAAEALGWVGAVAVNPLLKALNHESMQVRIRASAALLKIGVPDHFPAISKSLSIEIPENTLSVSETTEGSGEDVIIDQLISFLKHKDEDIRLNAAWALGYFEALRAVKPLIRFLEAEKLGGFGSMAAVQALGYIGDERAVESLVNIWKNVKINPLNWYIALALARIGESSYDKLIEILNDDDLRQYEAAAVIQSSKRGGFGFHYSGARMSAVRALAWLGQGGVRADTVFAYLSKALTSKNTGLRFEAAKAMGQLGDPRAVDPLIDALQDKNYLVRASAAWALGELGYKRAVDSLLEFLYGKKFLGGKRGTVQFTAASALASIGDQRACDLLISMSRQNRVAAQTLVDMDSIAFDPLISKLKNEKKNTPDLYNAIGVLGMMKAKRAVDKLAIILKNKNAFNRKSAAWALGEIGDLRAQPFLIESLTDKKTEVRQNAAWALGKIGDSGAVESLISIMNNQEEKASVRQNATWALGKIKYIGAFPSLLSALRDYNVGEVAYWSCKQISGEDFGFRSEESIESWNQWYDTL